MPELIIASRRIVTPAGVIDGAVVVKNGRIAKILPPGSFLRNADVYDCGDRALLPGLVDAHVHINEPGRAEWEGFATATCAAAAGGGTTVVDMPLDSSSVETDVGPHREKLRA